MGKTVGYRQISTGITLGGEIDKDDHNFKGSNEKNQLKEGPTWMKWRKEVIDESLLFFSLIYSLPQVAGINFQRQATRRSKNF